MPALKDAGVVYTGQGLAYRFRFEDKSQFLVGSKEEYQSFLKAYRSDKAGFGVLTAPLRSKGWSPTGTVWSQVPPLPAPDASDFDAPGQYGGVDAVVGGGGAGVPGGGGTGSGSGGFGGLLLLGGAALLLFAVMRR